jgi:hypothetical protein
LAVLEKVVRKIAGHGGSAPSFVTLLLVGGGSTSGVAAEAGWAAIVGGSLSEHMRFWDVAAVEMRRPQSTWTGALDDRGMTRRQAFSSPIMKLLLWHWSQPLVYLWIYGLYFCDLNDISASDEGAANFLPSDAVLASVVAAREIVYLMSSSIATATCPVFLLLDPFTLWKESDTMVQRWTRAAVYIMTPHNYVAICLANKHRRFATVFLVLACFQVAADFASCGALMILLRQRILNEELHPTKPHAHTPLLWGYGITAVGFLLFWGPLSISEAFKVATDPSKPRGARGKARCCGWALFLGVFYILLYYVLLLGHSNQLDVLCTGYPPILPAITAHRMESAVPVFVIATVATMGGTAI